jgi:thioredoxin reductase (NADPH)
MVPPTKPKDSSTTHETSNASSQNDEELWILPEEARATLSEVFKQLQKTR